ncbi:hypothetical protein IEQ34_008584 [Dendrobium chrysotoxum]|uniref:Uncharacterized protein n=1 Tax=Dendrobium chrysotoxum TaxID=161865 RepID=A0AAV7GGZ0_DENCH|nr:hypothetical protein IEQ34_008584 [Dendrobium chrysotoxum]
MTKATDYVNPANKPKLNPTKTYSIKKRSNNQRGSSSLVPLAAALDGGAPEKEASRLRWCPCASGT